MNLNGVRRANQTKASTSGTQSGRAVRRVLPGEIERNRRMANQTNASGTSAQKKSSSGLNALRSPVQNKQTQSKKSLGRQMVK